MAPLVAIPIGLLAAGGSMATGMGLGTLAAAGLGVASGSWMGGGAAGAGVKSILTARPKVAATSTSKASDPQNLTENSYAQVEMLRRRQGAASTILTGPQGVLTPPQLSKQTLG